MLEEFLVQSGTIAKVFLSEANGLSLYSPCGQLTSGHVLWGIEQN